MKRLLHLILTHADEQSRSGAASLDARPAAQWESRVVRIGPGGSLGSPLAAARWLRAQKADIVHAWGLSPLAISALAARCPVVCTPPSEISSGDISWMQRMGRVRPIRFIASSNHMLDRLLAAGIAREQCELIVPGLEMQTIAADASLRCSLGIAADDRVILAAGESTRWAAHEKAIWAAGILHVLDPRYRLLVLGDGDRVEAMKRFAGRLRQPGLTVFATSRLGAKVSFERLLSVADVAVVTATGPVATWPILTTMAAGVPIVATRNAAEELLNESTAALVGDDTPRGLAQTIRDTLSGQVAQRVKCARERVKRENQKNAFIHRHWQIYQSTERLVSATAMT